MMSLPCALKRGRTGEAAPIKLLDKALCGRYNRLRLMPDGYVDQDWWGFGALGG